ncbi:MAG: ribonuclease P protein component [Chloroflexi bacterium]|nr:ribonuclease P protein component [Chloroflexota bacterium]
MKHQRTMRGDQRLRRKSDFDAVFREGISRSSGVLAVRARQRDAESAELPCRFGFAVSKRMGGAVVRNRIRRRLRTSAARLNDEGACRGLDVVVIARQGAAEADFARLDHTLQRLIRDSANRLFGGRSADDNLPGSEMRGAS